MPVLSGAALAVALLCAIACSHDTPRETKARRWPAWLGECAAAGVTPAAGLVRCGALRVPESTTRPDGRQIDLRVVVRPARAPDARPDPIVPLVGGPGQGAADLADVLARRYASLGDAHDLVFVDQRGTGASNGLHCPPAPDVGGLMGRIFDRVRLIACRDELARRADLAQYTTAAAAGDYGRVFDALGYAQVNLIGVSYGTRMALAIARRFPNRVRSMALEGVVPLDFAWPTTGAPDAEAALQTLLQDCATDPSCAAAAPRAGSDVARAFAGLARAPAAAVVEDPMTGETATVPFGASDLAYAARGLLYGNEALSLPWRFAQAAAGRYEGFAQAYVARARTLEQQIARGAHLSVYCADDLPYVDWRGAVQRAAGTYLGLYLLDQYRAACEVWPRGVVPSSFHEELHSAIPTLLMSGRRDPVTPPRTAHQVARTLARARVIVWHDGGHGTDGLAAGACRDGLLRDFIASADPHALVADCVATGRRLSFAAPARTR